MRKCLVFCLAVVLAVAFTVPAMGAVYWPDKWWPSKWGADDEKGAFNLITPANVMRALKVVKTGKIYRLGMPYSKSMPLFGSRSYSLTIPGLPTGGVLGDNKIVWNDEFVVGEMGQIGTQFDGPGHVAIMGNDGAMRWYNGRELAIPENTYGLKKNGIEKVGPCITRGVLIDLVGLKGRGMNKGEIIYPKDIEACIQKAGIAGIQEGDAVLYNTGWGRYWNDAVTFSSGCPGQGIETARYMVKKNVSMLAADTWPVDVIPGESETGAFDIHNFMETVNGIWYLENISTDVMSQMAADGTYEFLWIFVPLPLAGATGSPGDAIAIK